MYLAGATVEADIGQRPDRPELTGNTLQLEDQLVIRRLSSGIAVRPQPPNIICRTLSGTSDVPDTVSVARSGSQSSSVT